MALQDLLPNSLQYVISADSSKIRKSQGWSYPDLGMLSVTKLSSHKWWSQGTEIIRNFPDAVHIFNGFWVDRRFFPLIAYAIRVGTKVSIINESYATVRLGLLQEESPLLSFIKVKIRPPLYQMAAALLNNISSGNSPCIIAISSHAEEQLLRAGFKKEQIFPFGYFVQKETPAIKSASFSRANHPRLIFMGTLLKTKGLDIAIAAVEDCIRRHLKISLDIYGPGNLPSPISSASKSWITYKGVVPFGEAQQVISQYDALVLPSRHDGWGVVINEALLQGIPAIASSNVGAKCLIESLGAGAVFKNDEVDGLIHVLDAVIHQPKLLEQWKSKARIMGIRINPQAGAGYLHKILMYYFEGAGEVPVAPWLKN